MDIFYIVNYKHCFGNQNEKYGIIYRYHENGSWRCDWYNGVRWKIFQEIGSHSDPIVHPEQWTSVGWEFGEPFCELVWPRCAECDSTCFADYLCSDCRAT